MGTSEEVRSEHQTPIHQHQHHAHPNQHQYSRHQHVMAGRASTSPSASMSSSSWPHEKLSDAEISDNDHTHDMDVDPSYDSNNSSGNEPMSPSPTHYGTNGAVFQFNSDNQHQHHQHSAPQPPPAPHNFGGLVATPITRFLTKQNFGYIPKPSFPSATDGIPRSAPSSPLLGSPLTGNKMPSLRLPSLAAGNGSSPLASPHGAFSLPAGETLSRLFGSASIGSAPGTPTSSSNQRGSTVSLPPLKRACPSPTTRLPPLSQQLSIEDICKPFPYQRSHSCPSDAMARAAAEEAAHEAYAAPRIILHPADVPKNRLERSSSVDASAVIAAREAHARALHGGELPPHSHQVDVHGWLADRSCYPLASLAESAHAVRMLEERRGMDSPRGVSSLVSPSESGEDSRNLFSVTTSDLKREKKLCAFPDCSSNAVTRGLCISHGGGRRCQRKGCTRGAQSKGLCVAHGGGRICRAKGCSNIQRSMGLCIRHGGGKRCSVPGCQKGVVRQDLCTAHGGKRKCKIEDCNKHVKKKGLCRSHANSVLGSGVSSNVSSPRGSMSPEHSS